MPLVLSLLMLVIYPARCFRVVAKDDGFLTGDMFYQVYKDAKAPFLLSGCKVSDGYGTMLVVLLKVHSLAVFS